VNGGSGGAGVGYTLPASLGAALANKRTAASRSTFSGDGDLHVRAGDAVDGRTSQDPDAL
jgi:acetolactate synthase-1/2/3 large subunit